MEAENLPQPILPQHIAQARRGRNGEGREPRAGKAVEVAELECLDEIGGELEIDRQPFVAAGAGHNHARTVFCAGVGQLLVRAGPDIRPWQGPVAAQLERSTEEAVRRDAVFEAEHDLREPEGRRNAELYVLLGSLRSREGERKRQRRRQFAASSEIERDSGDADRVEAAAEEDAGRPELEALRYGALEQRIEL